MLSNITNKERNLIKGAIRRVFSRSDLRRLVIEESRITHYDPNHPRVTKWSRCSECKQPEPTYKCEVDHIIPIIPINKSLEDMTWDQVIGRIFCSKDNLDVKCKKCHSIKTKQENSARAKARKEKKNVRS